MPPAAIGTSTISFGLVNVKVRLHPATQDHDIRFHQAHSTDGGRIQYRRVCMECGETVPYYGIDRCYVSPAGQQAIVTDDDLARLPAAEKAEIPVLQFVPLDQIDPLLLHKSYYLEPADATPRAYRLLANALARTDRVAITHLTLHRKTRLAALRVRGRLLVLQTLLWPDEVREVRFGSLLHANPPGDPQLGAAQALAYALSGDFDPDDYTDEYQTELKRLLDDAVATRMPAVTEAGSAKGSDAEVDDLIAALRSSLNTATVEL
ncbi:MAG: Ku protein, partial [Candidatus Nanopelagicales bacterium]